MFNVDSVICSRPKETLFLEVTSTAVASNQDEWMLLARPECKYETNTSLDI